mmetsp:Transcript_15168/g.28536  ORF Transcript_15168/g.28536 Transcript_15168/m.28536 type:complete len:213 (-) Transcript_15168:86-724(-)
MLPDLWLGGDGRLLKHASEELRVLQGQAQLRVLSQESPGDVRRSERETLHLSQDMQDLRGGEGLHEASHLRTLSLLGCIDLCLLGCLLFLLPLELVCDGLDLREARWVDRWHGTFALALALLRRWAILPEGVMQLPLGHIDSKPPTVVLDLVQLFDRSLDRRGVGEVGKSVAFWLLRVLVVDQSHRRHHADLAKQLLELVFLGIVGHIADKD